MEQNTQIKVGRFSKDNKVGRFSKDNKVVVSSSKQGQVDKNAILPERPKEIKKERGE